MTWLPLLLPGLIALLGSWRASVKASAELKAQVAHLLARVDRADRRADRAEQRADEAEAHAAKCEANVDQLLAEMGLKQRDENAGGGSLHHVAHEDEPITRKRPRP